MPGNNDDLLGRLFGRDRIDRAGEDEDDYRPPPTSRAWSDRNDGPALVLARLGVAFGFILLIAPGWMALRAYRDWREGLARHAKLPWALGVTALWTAVIATAFLTSFGALVLLVGIVALPAALLPVVRA